MTDTSPVNLDDKSDLLAFLATLPRQVLRRALAADERQHINVSAGMQQISALGQDFIMDTTNYTLPIFTQTLPNLGHLTAEQDQNIIAAAPEVQPEATKTRSLRPLNAFMAFRSWYSRICPDAPQKDISSLITKLWEKDGFRNSWSLVAKMYSSIRDIVGKDNVSLKEFLAVACPIMHLVSPADYLDTYHWEIRVDQDGMRELCQNEDTAKQIIAVRLQKAVPATEIDLLHEVLKTGFMPNHAQVLIQQMTVNFMGVMITTGGNKIERFANVLLDNPNATAAKVFGGLHHVSSVNITQVDNFENVEEGRVLATNSSTFQEGGFNFDNSPSETLSPNDGNRSQLTDPVQSPLVENDGTLADTDLFSAYEMAAFQQLDNAAIESSFEGLQGYDPEDVFGFNSSLNQPTFGDVDWRRICKWHYRFPAFLLSGSMVQKG
ncbi:hypothetical protein SODALDRAFT_349317 [Sodiomyces alkalinus F11]|uniref:Alpha box domain-containing protein n=1 Tax=Sodiomyces alkalinus (strain CBS 110278 / VKM F-3762 / F11) TaxID=1314773 RepID=A0A3N2Q3E3_SODAK|nr:hypothetical protein SODALDRAFT_349317 [Sodiomyces alkalinus F11]ROT41291.1 hypothetical protein SODALDRAFT_349317 [Sodiomyces alkalinus F11]